MAAMRPTRRRAHKTAPKVEGVTIADFFKARFGYGNTPEKRRCVRCAEMLPDCEFDVPFAPADTTVNICGGCKLRPQASSLAEAFAEIENR